MYFCSIYLYGLIAKARALTVITLTIVICFLAMQTAQVTFATEGIASWYGPNYAGKTTANGEIYNPRELTAAHQSIAFNTIIKVTNLSNGQSVVVRINDRGPFVGNRIIDLSEAAAERIDMKYAGLATVRLNILQAGDVPDVITPVDTSTYALGNSAVLNAVATKPIAAKPIVTKPIATNPLPSTSIATRPVPVNSITSPTVNNYSNANYSVPNTVPVYPSHLTKLPVEPLASSEVSNQVLDNLRLVPDQAINYSYGFYDPLDVLVSGNQGVNLAVANSNTSSNAISSRPYVGTVVEDISISHSVSTDVASVGSEVGVATSSTIPTLTNNTTSPLTIQIMPGLSKQEVILENYPIGAQLLLASATGEQTWVQVISSQLPPEVTDTFLISEELATFLGTSFELLAQR